MSSPTESGQLGTSVPPVTGEQPAGLAFPQSQETAPADENGASIQRVPDPFESSGPGMSSPASQSGGQPSSTGLSDVATTAADQGGEVLRETGRQARQLMDTTKDELREQAAAQQTKIAGGLSSLGDELRSMASSSAEPGLASDLAEQAADRLSSIGTWLDEREPGQLLDEVRRFAAQRPGTFLAVAAGIGLLAGRATRGLASSGSSGSSSPTGSMTGQQIDIRDEPRHARPGAWTGDGGVDEDVASGLAASSVGDPVRSERR